MKYVAIADLHLHVSGYSLQIDGIPDKIYFPLVNLRKAVELAKEQDAILMLLGDLIDSSNSIPQIVFEHLYDALDECKSNVPTYIVMGNHDYTEYKNRKYSYLNKIDIPVAKSGNPLFIEDSVLIGHSYNRDDIVSDFQQIDLETVKIIFSHFGIQEAQVGNTKYRGGEFSIKDFTELKDGLVILGHYHKPQKVSEDIYYVGSPVPIRVDEKNDDKRIMIIDSETNEITSIPTEYPKIKTLEIDYTSEIPYDTIGNEITQNYHRFVLVLPHDHPDLKKAYKLKNEFLGYVSIYEEKHEDENQKTKEIVEHVMSSISISNISEEFLTKSNVPKEKHPEYLNAVSEFL